MATFHTNFRRFFRNKFFLFKKEPTVLVLACILTTTGLVFVFETLTNWKYSTETWPIYTLGLAIGLFQYYIFSKKNNTLLLFIYLLAFISIFSFAVNFLGKVYYWLTYGLLFPCLIIVLEVYVFLKTYYIKKKYIKLIPANLC